MPNEQSNIRKRTRMRLQEPKYYKVIMHNDDFTTMEFVMMVLKSVFRKNAIEAEQIMLTVHQSGKAVVEYYSYDMANSKSQKAMRMAREQGFPLKLTVEPDDPPHF